MIFGTEQNLLLCCISENCMHKIFISTSLLLICDGPSGRSCIRKCHNLNSLSLVLLVELHLWDEAWKKMSHVIYFQIFYRVAIIYITFVLLPKDLLVVPFTFKCNNQFIVVNIFRYFDELNHKAPFREPLALPL